MDTRGPLVGQILIVPDVQMGEGRNPPGNEEIHFQGVNSGKFLVGHGEEVSERPPHESGPPPWSGQVDVVARLAHGLPPAVCCRTTKLSIRSRWSDSMSRKHRNAAPVNCSRWFGLPYLLSSSAASHTLAPCSWAATPSKNALNAA